MVAQGELWLLALPDSKARPVSLALTLAGTASLWIAVLADLGASLVVPMRRHPRLRSVAGSDAARVLRA